MDLTVREAAVLLGRSVRTVRDQAARGALPARRSGRGWVIASDHLPLTEAQRRALQARAGMVRDVVDQALPSRDARSSGDARRSLADLDAFRALLELRADASTTAALPDLDAALLAIGEAAWHWDREAKATAAERARAALGRAEVRLRLASRAPPPALDALLHQVGPAVAGYARWIGGLPGRRR